MGFMAKIIGFFKPSEPGVSKSLGQIKPSVRSRVPVLEGTELLQDCCRTPWGSQPPALMLLMMLLGFAA